MKSFKGSFLLTTITLMSLMICISSISANAGNLEIGYQGRYSFMKSGLAQIMADAVAVQLERELASAVADAGIPNLNSATLDMGEPEGSGIISGPVISYKTDDGTWEFNAHALFLGHFTTIVDATMNLQINPIPAAVPYGISTELKLQYRDIGGEISRYFFENFRVSAGYNYQYYQTDLETNYSNSAAGGNFASTIDFSFLSHVHILYLAGGYQHTFLDWITLNADFAFGCPVGGTVDQEMNIIGNYYNFDFSVNRGNIEWAYFLMGEISVTFLLADRVSLMVGYQVQAFNLRMKDIDANADGIANETADAVNLFHGFVFQAAYRFNI